MFVLQNAPLPSLKSPELELTPLEIANDTAKFDLTLSVTENADGLLAAMEYNADLFDAPTIDRMLGHFHTLLGGIVAQPDTPISQLPMMTEAELRLVLGQGNTADTDLDLEALDLEEFTDTGLDSLLLHFEKKDGIDE
jgi:non-ribosomal peptide synthetase component F